MQRKCYRLCFLLRHRDEFSGRQSVHDTAGYYRIDIIPMKHSERISSRSRRGVLLWYYWIELSEVCLAKIMKYERVIVWLERSIPNNNKNCSNLACKPIMANKSKWFSQFPNSFWINAEWMLMKLTAFHGGALAFGEIQSDLDNGCKVSGARHRRYGSVDWNRLMK